MPRRPALPRLSATTRACAAALLALAATPPPAAATTLVVLVSKRAIVIGADSMRTLAGGGTESVCKIHEHDGIVYGFAGAVSSDRFDATSIASRELAGGGDLRQKATRIADALQAGLVAHFKTRQIDRTRRELVEGQRGRPVTGFVAALVDGKPVGFLVLILADPSADGVVLTTKIEPLDTLGPDRAIFLSSQHQEVIQRANRTMGGRKEASVSELLAAATDLVALDLALEADRAPAQRKSGPPATVAVIDRGGFRFTAYGVCGPEAGSRPRSPVGR